MLLKISRRKHCQLSPSKEFEQNGKPWVTEAVLCPRCDGAGRYPSVVDNGICYKCAGLGYIEHTHRVLSEKEQASRRAFARSRDALRAEENERRRKENEENYRKKEEEEDRLYQELWR